MATPATTRTRKPALKSDKLYMENTLLRVAGALQRVLAHPAGARAAIRAADLTPWTRRNFARWLWEDYPRAVLGTPDRWHRGMLATAGAWQDARS